MQVKDLKANPRNPRKISDKKLEMLGASMPEFGDLSGIVLNKRTNRLCGGHQRLKHLDQSWKIEKHDEIDGTGTVAIGYILTPYGKWQYREVDWDEKKEMAANIAANHHGGEDDLPLLKDALEFIDDGSFNMDLIGIEEADIESLMCQFHVEDETEDAKADEIPEKKLTECPECGAIF